MIEWHDNYSGTVFGIPMRFVNLRNEPNARTTDDEIVVLKHKVFFDFYQSNFTVPKNVFEVGIFEGGSTLALAAMWPETKFVGIDIRSERPALLRHIERLGLEDRIELYSNVSQDDRDKVSHILDDFCPDLIIDDASHQYNLSKETFNIAFPYLEPGGQYILEDWGWAHWPTWPNFSRWEKNPALSNLVFELTLACATTPGVLESTYIDNRLMVAKKNRNCIALDHTFNLDDIYTARGKNLNELI